MLSNGEAIMKPSRYRNKLLACVRSCERMTSVLPTLGRLRPLRGSFSAFEALEKGQLAGAILARSQQPGSCPPGSITDQRWNVSA